MDLVASESNAFQNSSGQPVKTDTVEVVQEDPDSCISSSDRTGGVHSTNFPWDFCLPGTSQQVEKVLSLIGKKFKELCLTNIYTLPPPMPLPLHSLLVSAWVSPGLGWGWSWGWRLPYQEHSQQFFLPVAAVPPRWSHGGGGGGTPGGRRAHVPAAAHAPHVPRAAQPRPADVRLLLSA